MSRFTSLVLGALAAPHIILGVTTQSTDCIPQCSATTRARFVDFGCENADAAGCLCIESKFYSAVRDCVAGCGETAASVRQALVGFCPGLIVGESILAAKVSNASQPGTHTLAPIRSFTLTSTTSGPTSVLPISTRAQKPLTSQSTSTSGSATLYSTSIVSATQMAAASTAYSGIQASATASHVAASGPSSSSQSPAAIIRIGVGVVAGVIAIACMVFCLLRDRKRRSPGRLAIGTSGPLPRASPTNCGPGHGSLAKSQHGIKLSSHRYEDMVPGRQPRMMVR